MHRIVITAVAALLVGTAAAQIRVASATPEDVARALAESPGPWAEAAIELVVGRGLYIGYPDGSFGWRDDITRAEMAVVIARLVRAYGLEDGWVTQDAEALAVLRAAAEELRADLAGLAALVAEQGATLEGLAGALGRSEAELGALREAVSVLQAAPAALDAAALRPEIEALEARVADLEGQLQELGSAAPPPVAEPAADEEALQQRLRTVEARLVEERDARDRLAAEVAELAERIGALEAGAHDARPSVALVPLTELDVRLVGVNERLAALEERLAAVEETLGEHAARLARLEQRLLPERAPFYVSLAVYGSSPDGGLIGHAVVGHDAVVGNLGARVSVDVGFDRVPMAVSGALTYRSTLDQADGYAGLGLGASFEPSGTAMFGEMLVGVSYRLFRHVGVYVEGRYRPYFDGSGAGLSALGTGLRLSF